MRPEDMKLILASGSPRRTELLSTALLAHEVMVSGADEDVTAPDPRSLVELLSASDFAVIGADTVVALDGVILGKPADEAQAARMLRMLSGRSHHVYTGVTLHGMRDWKERIRTFSEESLVHVAQLSEEEIASYLSSGEAMDKAGAYGIQGSFMKHVSGIEGDYFNIVGLPVSHLYQALKQFIRQD